MLRLSDELEKGTFGNLGKPKRIVDTLLSKLFFFDKDVYKVYKHRVSSFGDFNDNRFRHEFYHDDFAWNNTMTPAIYTKLCYVRENNGFIEECTHDQSTDYYILMKKIDDSHTLLNLLRQKAVTHADLEKITTEMLKRIEKLTEIKKSDFMDLFDTQYVELDLEYIETLRDWMYMAPEVISKENADAMMEKLKSFINTYQGFKDFDHSHYIASIDNHCGNILYQDKEVNFIDSMPPMRIWRVQNHLYPVSRPATEVELFMGKEFADTMYSAFEKVRGIKVDPKMRAYLQTVAALIQAPYMYVSSDIELAGKFWKLAQEKSTELN
ncbi:MAG: hypothetical protein QG640_723 [Patescibacteria group bacterium]|nr:hypothetical protein [Patescibacteria group bacterium]